MVKKKIELCEICGQEINFELRTKKIKLIEKGGIHKLTVDGKTVKLGHLETEVILRFGRDYLMGVEINRTTLEGYNE